MIVWAQIAATLKTGAACALVTVAEAAGSTPREKGARMIVLADGSFFGTIGGGTLEFEAIHWAKTALSENRKGLAFRKVSLGPDLGQCCGGRADVAIEIFETKQLEMALSLADQEASGRPFSTRSVVRSGQSVIRSLTNLTEGTVFHRGDDGVLLETFGMRRRSLYLFGAGHVGKALVLALAPLPFAVTWLDSRAEVFWPVVPGNVQKVLLDRKEHCLEKCLADAPPDAFVLALTHSHALDEEIMAASLAQQRFSYCGVIGSRTKRARFEKRLMARGIPKSVVSNMVCPVGSGTVSSKLPAAIAAGVAVDLLERDEALVRAQIDPERIARSGASGH